MSLEEDNEGGVPAVLKLRIQMTRAAETNTEQPPYSSPVQVQSGDQD